jgi:hypothetical protein
MKAKPTRHETPGMKDGTTLALQIGIVRSGHAFAAMLASASDCPFPIDGLFPFLRIIRSANHRYVRDAQNVRRNARRQAQTKGETAMRKTIFTVLGASLIAALTMQMSAAAEHHHIRKPGRAPASEQFQNSNAYAAPAYAAFQSDRSRYSGGMSAPAGR